MKCIILFTLLMITSFCCQAQTTDSTQKSIVVSIVHGHKISAKQYRESRTFIKGVKKKSVGGLKGGHVEVHIKGFVYGFTDDPPRKMPHIFGHKKNSNGIFKKFAERKWQENNHGNKVTFVEIPISEEQFEGVISTYENNVANCPYDFALLGRRCASSCYEILANAGLFKKRSRLGTNLGILHPRAFRKYLLKLAEEKNYTVRIQEGSLNKKWDK